VGSSLFVPTVWASWSILEGHRWVPDLHIRGLCTVLLGAQDMVLVVGGWDVGTSYRIPIAGRAELGLYAGYQQLGISSSTQNINFDPQHQSSQALWLAHLADHSHVPRVLRHAGARGDGRARGRCRVGNGQQPDRRRLGDALQPHVVEVRPARRPDVLGPLR
jgi:hypothetical protein